MDELALGETLHWMVGDAHSGGFLSDRESKGCGAVQCSAVRCGAECVSGEGKPGIIDVRSERVLWVCAGYWTTLLLTVCSRREDTTAAAAASLIIL